MYGRSCLRLLAILFLISPPFLLHGQTDRADPATSEFAPDWGFRPPRVVQPPVPAPTPPLPHAPIAPPITIGFPQFARAAGMIFSGTVTAIEPRPRSHGQAVEIVAVTFHVEDAIRGVTPGQDLTIKQWIGLWSAGQRYRVGERALLFLYPPSKLGLTSCVAWPMGRFSIDGWGRVLLSAQHLSAFRADPVLGGKAHVRISDFAQAVRRASEEE